MTAGLDSDVFYQQMSNEAEGYVDVTIQNCTVPKQTTTYIGACVTLSDLLEQGLPPDLPLQIIGFDPLVDTHMLPHHMVLYGSPIDFGDDVARTKCKSTIEEGALQGWAVGSGPTLRFSSLLFCCLDCVSFTNSVCYNVEYRNKGGRRSLQGENFFQKLLPTIQIRHRTRMRTPKCHSNSKYSNDNQI
jgi:hypothetical protein